jgi:hypothetical protein
MSMTIQMRGNGSITLPAVLREKARLSVEELLEGLLEERRKLYEERLRDAG